MRKSVAISVTQFVLAGLAAVVLISAGTIYVVRRNATSEAIRTAREVAGLDGHAGAEPVLADGGLAADPGRVGRLLLLFLVQVPLAWSMARGLRQGQEERERLLQRAIDASDAERRRIARDLHDGVVQSLAGVSYSLAAAAERLDGGPDGADVGRGLRQAAADTPRSQRHLGSPIIEIAPPNLHD